MKAAAALAPILFSSVLFAVLFGRRASSGAPPLPWRPPAPSNLPQVPSVPSVPTEQPQPRATPKVAKVLALHRYEVVADVLPVAGVTLPTAAEKILDSLRLDGAKLKTFKTVQRDGRSVTRVTFTVNSLINNEFPLERQLSTAGVGSVWVVSIREVSP